VNVAAVSSSLTVFGAELVKLLEERGLSLRAVALKVGTSHSHLSMVIHGKRGLGQPPTDGLVERLAAALEVEPDTFADYRRKRAVEQYGDAVDRLYRRRKAS